MTIISISIYGIFMDGYSKIKVLTDSKGAPLSIFFSVLAHRVISLYHFSSFFCHWPSKMKYVNTMYDQSKRVQINMAFMLL